MTRIVAGLLISLALAGSAGAQGEAPPRNPAPSLTVSGNGEVRVAPDEATVRLGVTRQAANARQAQDQVNEVAQRILDAVTRLNVPKEQIQTSQLTLSPVYEGDRPGQAPRIVRYQASNVITVRLEKLALVGPVIDAGLQAGANQLEGVSFGLREDRAARDRALRQAVEEARAKADVLAEALGVQILGVLEAQEGGFNVRPVFAETAMMARGGAMDATPVSPGEVTVNATVTIRYRIAGRGDGR